MYFLYKACHSLPVWGNTKQHMRTMLGAILYSQIINKKHKIANIYIYMALNRLHKTYISNTRLQTRWQSTDLLDLSWEVNIFATQGMSVNDLESDMHSDLGVTNKCRQIDKPKHRIYE